MAVKRDYARLFDLTGRKAIVTGARAASAAR